MEELNTEAETVPTREEFVASMSQGTFSALDEADLDEMYEGLYPQPQPVEGGGEGAVAPVAPDGDVTPEPPPPLRADGFSVFIDEAEVPDLRGLSVEDLLTKAQIVYKAMGQEQRRTLAEVVRNAQLGHLKGGQLEGLERDRAQLAERLGSAEEQLGQMQQQQRAWDHVVQQGALGNWEPMEALLTQYQQQLGQPAEQPLSPEALRLAEIEVERRGEQVMEQEIRPYLQQMAEQYSADVQQLEERFLAVLEQIPDSLVTPDRVIRLLTEELPMELEGAALDSNASPSPPAAPDPALQSLQETIEALKGQVASLSTAQLLDGAPPASGPSTPGGEELGDVPSFEKDGEFDLAAYNEWIRRR